MQHIFVLCSTLCKCIYRFQRCGGWQVFLTYILDFSCSFMKKSSPGVLSVFNRGNKKVIQGGEYMITEFWGELIFQLYLTCNIQNNPFLSTLTEDSSNHPLFQP